MKKIIILLLSVMLIITGCSSQTDEQIVANQSQFSITFNTIDHEANTASFTVTGLPNEEEFAQIQETIVVSMKANDPEKDTKYTVSVYTDLQKTDTDPVYGTIVYQNGKIVEGALTNLTQEEYITLSEEATAAETTEEAQ